MSVIGSQIKINIYVEPIHADSLDNIHLDECDFNCIFFTNPNKYILIPKNEMTRVNSDNYIALVNSEDLGIGTIKMTMEIYIPDPLFENGKRKEINTINTGIKICAKEVQY